MASWRDSFKRTAPTSKHSVELDDRMALDLANARVERFLSQAAAKLNINTDNFEGDFGVTQGIAPSRG